jgi:hypothetical protein
MISTGDTDFASRAAIEEFASASTSSRTCLKKLLSILYQIHTHQRLLSAPVILAPYADRRRRICWALRLYPIVARDMLLALLARASMHASEDVPVVSLVRQCCSGSVILTRNPPSQPGKARSGRVSVHPGRRRPNIVPEISSRSIRYYLSIYTLVLIVGPL